MILLRCMSPEGHEADIKPVRRMSAIRGKPDVTQACASTTGFDPFETWAAEDFRSAKALFVPSLKRDIVPSVAWT
jgi:hypothetical protein